MKCCVWYKLNLLRFSGVCSTIYIIQLSNYYDVWWWKTKKTWLLHGVLLGHTRFRTCYRWSVTFCCVPLWEFSVHYLKVSLATSVFVLARFVKSNFDDGHILICQTWMYLYESWICLTKEWIWCGDFWKVLFLCFWNSNIATCQIELLGNQEKKAKKTKNKMHARAHISSSSQAEICNLKALAFWW